MNRSKRVYASFAVIAATIILGGFQNCADPLPEQAEIFLSTGGGPRFKAGDAFSANKLPYFAQGRLIAELQAYPSLTGFKAVAIASNGFGAARGSTSYVSQDEANKLALETCQIAAQNMPCGLFAEGDLIKYDEGEFYANQVSVLETGSRAFDVTKIPGFPQYLEAAFLSDYNGTSQSKSIAIANSGVVMKGTGASQLEADRRALEFCEAVTDETCTLYASGNAVVFNVSSFNWNYTNLNVKFGPRNFFAAQVPFITNAGRGNSNVVNIPSFTMSGRNPVMAISRLGHFSVAATIGATLAANRAAALAACNSQVNDPKVDCVVYSENELVVMTRATLSAGNLP